MSMYGASRKQSCYGIIDESCSVGIGTQHAILPNNLEQALEGVVDDEHEVAKLISHPQGEGWEDPALKERLRIKLGRNYDVFVANTNGLWDLLERLCRKLRLDPTGSSSSTNARDAWKFRKIPSRAVYDDLIAKVDATNTILQTLIEQSRHHEETRKRHHPYHRLLQQYQNARKHVEGLFKTIIGGRFWPCRCKEHHCVYLQLQTNTVENGMESDSQSMFRMVFSNTDQQELTLRSSWVEVLAEPCKMADPPQPHRINPRSVLICHQLRPGRRACLQSHGYLTCAHHFVLGM